MNFLTDKDGVTKKDIAFIIVMVLLISVAGIIMGISMHNYFTDGLNEMNMVLLTMVFDACVKLGILVVAFFYGTPIAATIITNGKKTLSTLFNTNGENGKSTDGKPDDWIPESDRENGEG